MLNEHAVCFVLAHFLASLSTYIASTGQFQLDLMGENEFRVSGFVQSDEN